MLARDQQTVIINGSLVHMKDRHKCNCTVQRFRHWLEQRDEQCSLPTTLTSTVRPMIDE
uniref:Uncharacterized protein n=1 Tax=Aegilops tauschii subsp. strangulata TaxID=200361 RepID=A0A453RJM8_AEGTS